MRERRTRPALRSEEPTSHPLLSDPRPVTTHPISTVPSATLGREFSQIAIFPSGGSGSATPAAMSAPTLRAMTEVAASSGAGRQLDLSARFQLQPHLGADLFHVRVHADNESDQFARELRANALTVGSHIFFRQGTYQPASPSGLGLLAHEATHTLQQPANQGLRPDMVERVVMPERDHPAEREADRRAASVSHSMVAQPVEGSASPSESTVSAGQSVQTDPSVQSAHSSGLTVLRQPAGAAPTTAPTAGPAKTQSGVTITKSIGKVIPIQDVEGMGKQFSARQAHFLSFLEIAKKDVENIRNYFARVNGVYNRCYGHYSLVLSQAKQNADTEEKWAEVVGGVLTGVAVGVMFEDALTWLKKADVTLWEMAAEIGAEVVEGGIGLATKSDSSESWATNADLSPAFKQVTALERLDQLNTALLSLAVPGPTVFSNPMIQAERLSAELRVAEAGGARRMNDATAVEKYWQLKSSDVASMKLETDLTAAEKEFAALRTAYMAKQQPSDQQCEQDIWIPWIAKQTTAQTSIWLPGSVLDNILLHNHFVDIGLAMRGSRGGRLNADVAGTLGKYYDPKDPSGAYSAVMLIRGARSEQKALSAYWQDVFLMGPAGGATK
jgi:hypothetical protein